MSSSTTIQMQVRPMGASKKQFVRILAYSLFGLLGLSHAFQTPSSDRSWHAIHRHHPSVLESSKTFSSSSSSSLKATAAMDALDTFYKTQPFLAAFLTCSVKASAADFVAQSSSADDEAKTENELQCKDDYKISNFFEYLASLSLPSTNQPKDGATIAQALELYWDRFQESQSADATNGSTIDKSSSDMDNASFCFRRNIAFLLYGGLYQGMFLQFLYVAVYPTLLQSVMDPTLHTLLQVGIDIFVFGPCLTLPIAYIIRAILDLTITNDDEPKESSSWTTTLIPNAMQQGIEKYVNHVQTQNLLFKFWMVWGPAQTITFGLIPEHFRVVFVALISFFWVTILSAISAQEVTTVVEEEMEANVGKDKSKIGLQKQLHLLQGKGMAWMETNSLKQAITTKSEKVVL